LKVVVNDLGYPSFPEMWAQKLAI